MSLTDKSGTIRAQKLQARMVYSAYLIGEQAVNEGTANRNNSNGAAASAINNYALGPLSFDPTELAAVLQNNSAIPVAPPIPSLAPTAPTGVTIAYNTQNTAFLISWTAPTSDGGSPITQYNVIPNPASVIKTSTVTSTTYDFSFLTLGTSYTFTVTASNS